jgi:hypothetical protein
LLLVGGVVAGGLLWLGVGDAMTSQAAGVVRAPSSDQPPAPAGASQATPAAAAEEAARVAAEEEAARVAADEEAARVAGEEAARVAAEEEAARVAAEEEAARVAAEEEAARVAADYEAAIAVAEQETARAAADKEAAQATTGMTLLAGPDSVAPPASSPPSTLLTLTGTLLVQQQVNDFLLNGCGGYGRFAEFQDGTQVIVSDGTGREVGTGQLADCQLRAGDTRVGLGSGDYRKYNALFSFAIPVAQATDGYAVRIGWKQWEPMSTTVLEAEKWHVNLTVQ